MICSAQSMGHMRPMLTVASACRFHTVTTGRGQGKPLMLFLHGFPELWYSWRRQLDEFADDYEVLAALAAPQLPC